MLACIFSFVYFEISFVFFTIFDRICGGSKRSQILKTNIFPVFLSIEALYSDLRYRDMQPEVNALRSCSASRPPDLFNLSSQLSLPVLGSKYGCPQNISLLGTPKVWENQCMIAWSKKEEKRKKYVLSMASYPCERHYVVCAWMGDKDCLSKPRECEVMYNFYYIKKNPYLCKQSFFLSI